MATTDQAFIRAYQQPVAETVATADREEPAPAIGTMPQTKDAASAGHQRSARPEGTVQPSFQVDSFAWPSGCTRLGMIAGVQVDRLAGALTAGLTRDQKVLAFSGCRRGEGCTTLLLCVARQLADSQLRIAVVDADLNNPMLARRLGLLPEVGWEEVLAGRMPVAEVIIESIQDRLSLVPLCGSVPGGDYPIGTDPEPTTSLELLREHYDLVLVDLGEFGDSAAVASGPLQAVINWIDAAVLVRDVRSTPEVELDETRRLIEAAGIVETGITENFVSLRQTA